jgi:hypothetical protein
MLASPRGIVRDLPRHSRSIPHEALQGLSKHWWHVLPLGSIHLKLWWSAHHLLAQRDHLARHDLIHSALAWGGDPGHHRRQAQLLQIGEEDTLRLFRLALVASTARRRKLAMPDPVGVRTTR